ncbi:organic cation transporter protein-like isoform X2 [Daphnia carinata]|uniref:organic cation transporter protein-like isoform X2 n=1 Tax=Daphnia carinata TaxID=120202 RepID=UPI002869247B|nr:organic cation transporter protein-like isoform X2 [Daphnia carinata]
MASVCPSGLGSYPSPNQQAQKTNTPEDEQQSGKELTAVDYEDILEKFGKTRNLQLNTFLWLCLPAFFPGIVVMSYTFTGGTPNYRCFVEACDENVTTLSNNGSYFAPPWLNQVIPLHKEKAIAQCYRYNITWARNKHCDLNQSMHDTLLEKCSHWVYDTSVFRSTIVSDFELTCESEWKQTIASSLFMLGMLVGAVSIGYIGDTIGRRKTFTLNVFTLAIVTTASAFSPDWITFCSLRFVSGIGASGHFLIIFVWGVEAVGNKYRITCGFIYQIIYAAGSACLGIVAYSVRDWRLLQLVISIPMFGFTTFYWILPESIRWLITKKHYPQVIQLLLQKTDVNQIHVVPDYVLASCHGETKRHIENSRLGHISTIELNAVQNGSDYSRYLEKAKVESLTDILRSNILMIRLMIISMAWMAGVMGYYGLTYSAANLVGNFHINYGLSMLVEIPAYLLCMVVVENIGRRPMLTCGLLVSGLCCLMASLLPVERTSVKTVFSMVAKLFAACVTATLYSYTSELFPTFGRSAIVGLCSTCGRIGGILAPIISDWGKRSDVHASMPFFVFATINILVGLLCFLLPETRKTSFPSTIKEAIEMKPAFLVNVFQVKVRKVEHQERH